MKKLLTKEKTWSLVGMVVGLIVILIGLVFMATPADSYSTESTDYASFGADYYSYEYDATRAAAGNAAATANNLRELSAKLALYSGTFFVVLGVLIALPNAKTYFCSRSDPSIGSPTEEPSSQDEPMPEEAAPANAESAPEPPPGL